MMNATQTPQPDLGSTPGAHQMPAHGLPTTQVCIPNISTAERRKRLMAGVVELVIGLAILSALMAFGVDRWWRLPLLLVFWGASSLFFQWRDHT
jgi:hypothetical protein